MTLETMAPDSKWEPEEHGEALETLGGLDRACRFLVWGDDGCKDCRRQLPAFGAALEAAGVPEERVVQYPVERLPEGEKRGPKVDEYGIERIPTVVVEVDGEEVARFVEEEDRPIAEYLASELRDVEANA